MSFSFAGAGDRYPGGPAAMPAGRQPNLCKPLNLFVCCDHGQDGEIPPVGKIAVNSPGNWGKKRTGPYGELATARDKAVQRISSIPVACSGLKDD
jgi:hypothetical protein